MVNFQYYLCFIHRADHPFLFQVFFQFSQSSFSVSFLYTSLFICYPPKCHYSRFCPWLTFLFLYISLPNYIYSQAWMVTCTMITLESVFPAQPRSLFPRFQLSSIKTSMSTCPDSTHAILIAPPPPQHPSQRPGHHPDFFLCFLSAPHSFRSPSR